MLREYNIKVTVFVREKKKLIQKMIKPTKGFETRSIFVNKQTTHLLINILTKKIKLHNK